MAPEHPFPAVDGRLAACAWVQRRHVELGCAPGRVGVMGDSTGGNLAAVVALATREGGVPPPLAQGLVYPAVDARLDTPSMHDMVPGSFGTGVVPDCLALATEVRDSMGAPMRRAARSGG